MSEFEEKRAFQRLQLSEPIPATINDSKALLLDVGVSGALVEHTIPLEVGSQATLRFSYDGQSIELDCEVVRTTSPQPLPSGVVAFPGTEAQHRKYQSGLRFTDAIGQSDELLRQMLSDHVGRILRAQQANAMGNRAQNVIDGDATITRLGAAKRSSESGYYTFRLTPTGWKRTFALLPDQPSDGFTIAAFEVDDEEHVQGLCRAYQIADEEGRRLIRLMAELSISEARGVPRKTAPTSE